MKLKIDKTKFLVIPLRIDEEMHTAIKKVAKENKVNVSKAMRELIKLALIK